MAEVDVDGEVDRCDQLPSEGCGGEDVWDGAGDVSVFFFFFGNSMRDGILTRPGILSKAPGDGTQVSTVH